MASPVRALGDRLARGRHLYRSAERADGLDGRRGTIPDTGNMIRHRLQLSAASPRGHRAVGVAPHDLAAGHFHLRHRGSAVWPFEARNAACEELLRAQRGNYNEFVGVEMNGSNDHRRFLWAVPW